MIRASIAMAVYNGEEFLNEQINSILDLLSVNDELIISYNESSDRTLDILTEYENNDPRVHVFLCKENGVAKNFQNAVEHCEGKYIFYSDQDDVWLDDKINICIRELKKSGKAMLLHDGYSVNKDLTKTGITMFNGNRMRSDPFSVWVGEKRMGGKALGCCMVFDRKFLSIVLPFPDNSHDVWTANILSRVGGIHIFYEKLIMHRLHGKNVSPIQRRKIYIVIWTRALLLIKLLLRIGKYKVKKVLIS